MTTEPGSFPMSPESFQQAAEPPRPGHGCFFYGCIAASVLAVLMLMVIAIGGYLGYRAYLKVVEQYTSPTRTTLPKVEMSEEDRAALRERFDAFKQALDEGEDAEPLVLSGDELNVLLAEQQPAVADRVYFVVEGDKLKGQVSLPLDEVGLPGLRGRYFNGKATFHASLRDGQLVVRADSAEINGQPLSEQFIAGLRNANLAEDAAKQPENARFLAKLESLQVKEGKVIIKAKPKEERATEATKTEGPAGESSTKPGGGPQPPAEKNAKEPPAEEPRETPAPPPAEKAAKPGSEEKSEDLSSLSTRLSWTL